MSLLLTEDSRFLITESGNLHLLIERASIGASFQGIALIYNKGNFWEMDLGRGPVRSTNPDRLEQMARKAGAFRIEYIE